jgi:hypothetical protein
MNSFIRCFAAACLCAAVLCGCASQPPKPDTTEITAPELQSHIQFLTSNRLAGRGSGTEGNRLAAEYIASEFQRYGLQPAGDNGTYFQEFRFTSGIEAGPHNAFSASAGGKEYRFAQDRDVRPLSFTTDTSITTGVVFAGYGITDTSLKYDDYAGIDVKGKIVFMLRYTPDGKKTESKFYNLASVRTKAFNAREHGATGLVMVTGPLDDEKPTLTPLTYDRGMGTSGIAAISMTWTACDSIFRLAGKSLRSTQEQINASKQPQSFDLAGVTASLQTDIKKLQSSSRNILAKLAPGAPSPADEMLVVGAHMDHLGMGGPGSGSLKPDTSAIHPGADDNASGTAGLLEMAQYLAAHRASLRRGVLFASFSGEEIGLLGSDYYVKHPTYPLASTVGMINMDMIGRMKDSVLVVEGIGTSPGFDSLVRKENTDPSILLKLKQDGYGPSDHASFYSKDMPVLFFFTNLHDDYHRPSDTWDKINYRDEQKVVALAARIAVDIASAPERPAFTKVAGSAAGGERRDVRVSLGVVPDYAEDIAGMKISGTRAGSAAEKAGLKGGDIIIKFGKKEIKNIYDFTAVLGEYKPGDEVVIVVKRGTEEVSLTAVLQGRQ